MDLFAENLQFEINPIYLVQQSNVESIIDSDLESNIVKECRICLDSNEEDDNKLISICNCKGSLEYIHRDCAIKWIKERNGNYTCELCKTKYDKKQLNTNEINSISIKFYGCCKKIMSFTPFIIVIIMLFVIFI